MCGSCARRQSSGQGSRLRIFESPRRWLIRRRAVRYLPKLDLTWILGPSPEARGDAINGDTNLSNLSIFSRTELSFLQPVYTFGRLDAARSAARAGVDARRAGAAGSRERLTAQVAEAYYGLLLAEHLSDLADEARTEIGKARDRIDQMLEADEGDYTYTDLFKLDRFVFDVEENANKVIKGRALISSALRRLMGRGVADSIRLADKALQPVDVGIGPLSDLPGQGGTSPRFAAAGSGRPHSEGTGQSGARRILPAGFHRRAVQIQSRAQSRRSVEPLCPRRLQLSAGRSRHWVAAIPFVRPDLSEG